jgi:dimethylargininase
VEKLEKAIPLRAYFSNMNKTFTKAVVRIPGFSMTRGLTAAGLGEPNYFKARKQHAAYVKALEDCGLKVTVLKADERYPDSCFIEDVALCTPHCVVITNPGAETRKGEISAMPLIMQRFYSYIEYISEPGTLEAGDVMMVNDHYFIGLSERTNKAGAQQLIAILEKYKMTGSVVKLEKVLHLKTGVAYLEDNTMLACGEFISKPEFKDFNIIEIPEEESYAANCIRVNDKVIIPKGFPKTEGIIRSAGFEILEVDVSEFRKLDGGLSCLSLRF